jgi:hypothetical protein
VNHAFKALIAGLTAASKEWNGKDKERVDHLPHAVTEEL